MTLHILPAHPHLIIINNKQDAIKQQDWKIERLARDNRALEAANCDLRAKAGAVGDENLQVSEKIVALDEECRALRLAAAEAGARADAAGRERGALQDAAARLRAEVADKVALLDDFEARFARQHRAWEEERAALRAELDAARREARRGRGGAAADVAAAAAAAAADADADEDGGNGGGGAAVRRLAEARAALGEAREREVLLLEAYEQLERDVGAEVDRALSRQAADLERLRRRAAALESALKKERGRGGDLEEALAAAEAARADAAARCDAYERGVYGLPQAAQEIRALKDALAAAEARARDLVAQANRLSAAAEDLGDENAALRARAGVAPAAAVDAAGVRQAREVAVTRLRGVVAALERQVADLEEERRKLRLELKFRAKYHGRCECCCWCGVEEGLGRVNGSVLVGSCLGGLGLE